jgi:hypothetical protein
MTKLGIGLHRRQVSPREDANLQPLDAAVAENEEGEEVGHREASVPPTYFEFEDAILFAELDSMDNMLSAGGQLKYTGDPGGPHSLTCGNRGLQLRWISNQNLQRWF